MFRQFKINDNIIIKAELLKNRREAMADISNHIDKVNYKFGDISTLELSVNKYIMRENKKNINPLYNKIKDKMQIVVYVNDDKERYTLYETTKKSSRNTGNRTFIAYSFEKTLEGKRIAFHTDGKSYPLVSDGIESGVLEEVCRVSGWKIGYVDDMAKLELVNSPVMSTSNMCKNIYIGNVQPDTFLWEKDIMVAPEISNVPTIAKIEHKGLTRYDSYGDELIVDETVHTELDPVHTAIRKIKATYHSEPGNRYAIKFEITLVDNSVITQIKEFVNLKDLIIRCQEVNVIFETGKWEKQQKTKYVWLESLDNSVYKFLIDIQDDFNVIFTFDTYNKLINCYDKNYLLNESPLELSYDNFVKDIEVKQVESPISAVKVIGKEELSIVSINKYGGDILYNYNYYIKNGLISDDLMVAINKYEEYLDKKQLEWNQLNERKILLQNNKIKVDCEIKSLTERIKTANEILSAYISAGGNGQQADVIAEINELQKLFNANIELRNTINAEIVALDDGIAKLNNSIKRENSGIFMEEDLLELEDIDNIENFSNDTATTSESLYNSAEWYLNERTKQTIEFNLTCDNLIKLIKNPLGWNKVLRLGNLFYLDKEISEEIGENQARLVGFTIYPRENKVDSLQFTNRVFKVDKLKQAQKMQKKAIGMYMNNNKYKSVWNESVNNNEFVDDIKYNGINVANMNIRTSETYSVAPEIPTTFLRNRSVMSMNVEPINSYNEELVCDNDIEYSKAGIFIKSMSNPNQQLFIGSSLIAFSSDGFRTSDVSIDKGGVVGRTIYGEIILGKKLFIRSDDESQTFYIGDMDKNDGFGLSIVDEVTGEQRIFLGTEFDENGIKKARLRLVGKNGQVAISEDGLVNNYLFVFNDELDENYPIEFDYNIDSGVFEIRECILSLNLQKYRMTVRAMSSGGSVSTTTEGGMVVSSTGDGGFVSTSTGDGGFYSHSHTSEESVEYPYQVYSGENVENDNGKHTHSYYYGVPPHKHSVNINIPNHQHVFNVPNHHHAINIPSHSHNLDTTHNHKLEAGIFEATLPSNCSVYINDVLVASGINLNTKLDIKDYLVLGSDNKIRITSDTLGRIQLSIKNKSFVGN